MQSPKAHEIDTEVTSLTAEELVQIRRDHGKAGGAILRNVANGDDEYKLGLGDNRYRKYLPIVATLCERHQSATTYEPGETTALSGRKIRVGALIGLLRVADQLDCDS